MRLVFLFDINLKFTQMKYVQFGLPNTYLIPNKNWNTKNNKASPVDNVVDFYDYQKLIFIQTLFIVHLLSVDYKNKNLHLK